MPTGAPGAAPGVEVRHEPQRGAGLQDTGLPVVAAAWVLADVVENEGRALVQGAEVQCVTGGGRDAHHHRQGAGLQAPPLGIRDLGGEGGSPLSADPLPPGVCGTRVPSHPTTDPRGWRYLWSLKNQGVFFLTTDFQGFNSRNPT